MISHISDKSALFSEISRILKDRGCFYAATNGSKHMAGLAELLNRFDPGMGSDYMKAGGAGTFSLESGVAQLSQYFGDVKRIRYMDGLRITESKPLIDHILSGWVYLQGEREAKIKAFVEQEFVEAGGSIHIAKDAGIFICAKQHTG